MTAPNPAEGSAKATPTKGPKVTVEGQKGKASPLEAARRSASSADSAPPRASWPDPVQSGTASSEGPLLPVDAGRDEPPSKAGSIAAEPATVHGTAGDEKRPEAWFTASSHERAAQVAVGGPGRENGEDGKERRGKRYTTFQSVRKGLAQVANELALGKTDAKTAAVRVQALQAIANVLAQSEYAKLSAEAEALEKQAKEPSKAVARA